MTDPTQHADTPGQETQHPPFIPEPFLSYPRAGHSLASWQSGLLSATWGLSEKPVAQWLPGVS